MNAYFAISAIFLLGLRGIDKKLGLPVQPMNQLTPEDKQNGKVRMMMILITSYELTLISWCRSRCYPPH